MPRPTCTPCSAILLLTAACATSHSTEPSGPPLEIPAFAADDPRVQTTGFVREVRVAETEAGDTRFVMMAFVVGDTLTLGAMTQGPFVGSAHWVVGGHRFAVDFAADAAAGEVPVRVESPATDDLTGQRAGFRGYQWINVEVGATDWLRDPVTAVSLTFARDAGDAVALPAQGAFAARRVAR